MLFSNKTDSVYEELTEENGILTFFYHDSISDDTLVISQSNESGVIAYYNDGKNIYEISNLYSIDLNHISTNFDLNNLAQNFISEYLNFEYTKSINILDRFESINENSIQPFGLPNVRTEFHREVGNPFPEKLVASSTIDGKRVQVYETKDVTIKQMNRVKAFAGETMAFLLSLLKLPKPIAIGLGVVTVIKSGIEYLKYDYTFLEYRGDVDGYKDITVQGRSTHEVACGDAYKIWENTENDAVDIDLLWGWEDTNFRNNQRLMETAVSKY